MCVPGEKTGPSCCSTSHHTQPRETPFVVVAGLHDSGGGGGGSEVMGDEGWWVGGVGGLSAAIEFDPLGPRERKPSVRTMRGKAVLWKVSVPSAARGRRLSMDRHPPPPPKRGGFAKNRPQLGPARHFCSHRRSVSLSSLQTAALAPPPPTPPGHAVCHFPLRRHTQPNAHWIRPLTPDP